MKKIQPVPGASVTAVAEPREPITQMLAPEPEKQFEDSLPESTLGATTEGPQRRTRRTKAEMDAARGKPAAAPTEADPRLERAKAKFTSLGAGSTIKAGFLAAKKPLDHKEAEDVDDYFYMVGSKSGLDPTQSWVMMFFCALLLVARLIFVRTDLGDNLKDFFFPEQKEKAKESEDEKNDKR